MTSLDTIKNKIQQLHKTNPNIHMNIAISSPKVNLKNEPVVITGVYPHVFQIEEQSSGATKRHTFQYTDIFLHHIEIVELEKNS